MSEAVLNMAKKDGKATVITTPASDITGAKAASTVQDTKVDGLSLPFIMETLIQQPPKDQSSYTS